MHNSPSVHTTPSSITDLRSFWWTFALRGGFAILFAALLLYTSTLMGTVFFDPILLVVMGLLIGFFVFGNGIILCVAAVVAAEHHRPIWRVILAESIFTLALGVYIAAALFISPRSVAVLAGLHALGTGCFEFGLAIKLRTERRYKWYLGTSGIITVAIGMVFLTHQGADVRPTTAYFSAFELFHGIVFVLAALWLRNSMRTLVTSS